MVSIPYLPTTKYKTKSQQEQKHNINNPAQLGEWDFSRADGNDYYDHPFKNGIAATRDKTIFAISELRCSMM